MKKFRPYCSGYIVLYILVAFALADCGYTLYSQVSNTGNEAMQSFSMFSYLIAALAVAYASLYVRAKVWIDENNLRIAFPAYIRPAPDAKRAFFVFRQGDLDMKLIDKTIPIKQIERYGYVDDLGFDRVDKSSGGPKTPLFPIHEVCFLTTEGKRYHMNAAIYKPKQRREMFQTIQRYSGVAPEGSLADEIK